MPRKRAVPEYISHMIMAKEYTSVALVSFPSFSSSGAQYDTVPAQASHYIQTLHDSSWRREPCMCRLDVHASKAGMCKLRRYVHTEFL